MQKNRIIYDKFPACMCPYCAPIYMYYTFCVHIQVPVHVHTFAGKLVEKSSLENQKLDQPSTAKDGVHATIEDQMKEEKEEDKEEGEEHKAAVLIQSCVRGYLCRKHGHLARHRAATLIQSVW